jgi:hypothetical protein
MGFTQRQAAGKFTRGEAEAFTNNWKKPRTRAPLPPAARLRQPCPPRRPLSATAGSAEAAPAKAAPKAAPRTAAVSSTEQALRKIPSSMLAAELQRRGWVVMEP